MRQPGFEPQNKGVLWRIGIRMRHRNICQDLKKKLRQPGFEPGLPRLIGVAHPPLGCVCLCYGIAAQLLIL